MSGPGSVRGPGVGGVVRQVVDAATQAGHTAASVVTDGLSGSSHAKTQGNRTRVPLGGADATRSGFGTGALMAGAGATGQAALKTIQHTSHGARTLANGAIHAAATVASGVSQGVLGARSTTNQKAQAAIQQKANRAGAHVDHGVGRTTERAMRNTMGVFARVTGTTNPFANRTTTTTTAAHGAPLSNPPLANPFAATHGVKPPVF